MGDKITTGSMNLSSIDGNLEPRTIGTQIGVKLPSGSLIGVFCPVCLSPVAFRRIVASVPADFPVAPGLSWQGSVSAVPLPSQYPRISRYEF